MAEYCAATCEYLFINKSIEGEMDFSARYINCRRMRATRARILLGLALPKG